MSDALQEAVDAGRLKAHDAEILIALQLELADYSELVLQHCSV